MTVPIGATRLYYICFLNGTLIAAVVFVGLNYIFPPKALKSWIGEQSGPWRETQVHFREKWDQLAIEQTGGELREDGDVKRMDETVKEV